MCPSKRVILIDVHMGCAGCAWVHPNHSVHWWSIIKAGHTAHTKNPSNFDSSTGSAASISFLSFSALGAAGALYCEQQHATCLCLQQQHSKRIAQTLPCTSLWEQRGGGHVLSHASMKIAACTLHTMQVVDASLCWWKFEGELRITEVGGGEYF